jgi:hypothetical protein
MLVNCSRGLGERSGPAEQHIYTLINATKRCDVMSCGGGGADVCAAPRRGGEARSIGSRKYQLSGCSNNDKREVSCC